MNQSDQLSIFQAQIKNVKALNRARKHTKRSINEALRNKQSDAASIHTNLYALLYSAWVEAIFSKMIHTPYGFKLDEIKQIKTTHQTQGLGEAWIKCLELSLARIASSPKSNYRPNIQQKLRNIIEKFVINPSQIRNKIAHGQWVVALNRSNTSVNNEMTASLSNLNVVTIDIWFGVFEQLASIIETMIESPNRAFHRDYWPLISNLESFVNKSSNWTLEKKILQLQTKQQHHSA